MCDNDYSCSLMRLHNDRYEEIKVAVVNMFERLDIHCTPISGFDIAAKAGLTVIKYSSFPPEQMNLMLKVNKDAFIAPGLKAIYYNDKKPNGRIN